MSTRVLLSKLHQQLSVAFNQLGIPASMSLSLITYDSYMNDGCALFTAELRGAVGHSAHALGRGETSSDGNI
jgi:hypothetical protein